MITLSRLSILTLSLCICCYSTVFAQRDPVEVTHKIINQPTDEDNVIFFVENTTLRKQTILFTPGRGKYRLGGEQVPVTKTISPGSSKLITLYGAGYPPSYTIMYIEGCLKVVPEEVVYLLPLAAGKQATVYHLKNLGAEYFGKDEPKDWASFAFKTEPGDKVFAARRGQVIEVEESNGETSGTNLSYSRAQNYLIIEHEDCTYGRYEMLKEKSVVPEPGDEVEAGDLLGTVASGDGFSIGSHLRFMVYYREISRTDMINYRRSASKLTSRFFSPFFQLSDKTGSLQDEVSYEVEHPEEVIFQEMKKRQIKNWKKKH